MLPYIYFFIINTILLIINNFSNNIIIKKIVIGIVLIYAILFCGLRYDVGVDYMMYIYRINQINSNMPSPFEFGAFHLVKLINYLHLPIELFFFVTSVIVVLGFNKFIAVFSPSKAFSLFLFLFLSVFYLASFNHMRQFIAISFVLLALSSYTNNNLKFTILFFALALSFHISALLILPLFLIFKIDFKAKHFILFGILFFIVIYFSELLILQTKYTIYLERSRLMVSKRNSTVLIPFWLISLYSILFIYREKNENLKINILYKMNYYSFLLITASFFSSLPNMFFLRINSYLLPSFLCLLPFLINSLKVKQAVLSNILYFIFFLLTLLYYFFNIVNKGIIYNLTPYKLWI